jgi:hypothetical protein
MRSTMWRSILALAGLTMLAAGGVAAQTTYPNVKFGGMLQTQFYDYNNADNAAYLALPAAAVFPESEFYVRRARISAKGNISEAVSFDIEPQYQTGGAGVTVEEAYLDVAFTKPEAKSGLVLRAGQFKRYFGRYEQTSTSNLPSIERGTGRGLVPVASNDIAVLSGYMSLDIGAGLMFTGLQKRLLIEGAVMNGRGQNLMDNNNGKSLYARTTFAVTPKLSLGASYAAHESIRGVDSSASNNGFGLDGQWSAAGAPGLYVVFDYDNGETLLDSNNKLYGISLVTAYNIRMKSPTSFLYAIEPAFRYDFSEPNDNATNDQSTLITAGVNLYLSSKAQFRLMYQNQSFEDPALNTISGVLSALTINF